MFAFFPELYTTFLLNLSSPAVHFVNVDLELYNARESITHLGGKITTTARE